MDPARCSTIEQAGPGHAIHSQEAFLIQVSFLD
jgi:hypothetical protein